MTTTADPTQTGVESSLSNWAGPYVTNILGKAEALGSLPYEAYKGPLTAGASALQKQGFTTAESLSVPSYVGEAGTAVGGIADLAKGLSYTPTSFTNPYAAPAPYQQGTFDAAFSAPAKYQPTTFTNSFQAGAAYDPTKFTTDTFGVSEAQQYMNPYLQTALDPMLFEARRQADIARLSDAARLSQAGAFGGSRQAIMEAEGRRNLMEKQNQMLTQGYATAYDKAQQAFKDDQTRALDAQRFSEESRQFGFKQGASERELAARLGLDAQRLSEESRQYGYGKEFDAAKIAADMAAENQRRLEQSRQFGYGEEMKAAGDMARYGLDSLRLGEDSKQFGAKYGLDSLRLASDIQQARARMGLDENAAARSNLDALMRAGATEREIAAEGIAADKKAFEEQRDYPMKMLQFKNSLLQGMPLESRSYAYEQPSSLQETMGTLSDLLGIYRSLYPTGS